VYAKLKKFFTPARVDSVLELVERQEKKPELAKLVLAAVGQDWDYELNGKTARILL
jgi:hypothetical protein